MLVHPCSRGLEQALVLHEQGHLHCSVFTGGEQRRIRRCDLLVLLLSTRNGVFALPFKCVGFGLVCVGDNVLDGSSDSPGPDCKEKQDLPSTGSAPP